MRLVFWSLLIWWCGLGVARPASNEPAALAGRVQAGAALLMDARTGEVIFERRPDRPYPPASTVKLLTALLVWEATGLEGDILIKPEDTRVEPSHVPLRPGETVSVRDLTTALLVGSDNDTAMALGRRVAGSHQAFIRLMNQRARELGCTNTLFHNPNGLPAEGQRTTCRDMMRIFRAVLAVPELRRICSMPSFTLRTAVGAQRVKNHNKLLGVYPGMGPAKTGWTFASRHTYAASASRNGRELLLVLLYSPNKWNDARVLFDYGFSRPPSDAPGRPSPAPAPVERASTPSTPATPAPRLPTVQLRPSAEAVGAPTPEPPPRVIYTVQKGDTLFAIARRHGVSPDRLAELNTLKDPSRLQPGMQLRIR